MVSLATLGGLFVLFLVARAVYRLFFSPLAKIPGPKIAGESFTPQHSNLMIHGTIG